MGKIVFVHSGKTWKKIEVEYKYLIYDIIYKYCQNMNSFFMPVKFIAEYMHGIESEMEKYGYKTESCLTKDIKNEIYGVMIADAENLTIAKDKEGEDIIYVANNKSMNELHEMCSDHIDVLLYQCMETIFRKKNSGVGMERRMMIYNYIVEYFVKHGYAPTIREIRESVGLKSTSTVESHLKTLKEMKLIETDAVEGSPRAIRLAGYQYILKRV